MKLYPECELDKVAHAYNHTTQEPEASMGYIASSSPA